jgi:hypothetical protein
MRELVDHGARLNHVEGVVGEGHGLRVAVFDGEFGQLGDVELGARGFSVDVIDAGGFAEAGFYSA